MDPDILAALMAMFGTGINPETGKTQKQVDTNYLQDLLQMMNIPQEAIGALSGGFDPAAFAPTTTTQPLAELPSMPTFTRYLNGGGTEAEIARGIQAGGNPDEVVAALAETNSWDDATVTRWYGKADNMFTEFAKYEDALTRLPMDEQGNPVLTETTSKPSPAAQAYLDAGLPLPTDEWSGADFGEGRQVADVAGAQARSNSAGAAQQSIFDKLRAFQSQPLMQGGNGAPTAPGITQSVAPRPRTGGSTDAIVGALEMGGLSEYGQYVGQGNAQMGQTDPQSPLALAMGMAGMQPPTEVGAPVVAQSLGRAGRVPGGGAPGTFTGAGGLQFGQQLDSAPQALMDALAGNQQAARAPQEAALRKQLAQAQKKSNQASSGARVARTDQAANDIGSRMRARRENANGSPLLQAITARLMGR